MQVECVDVADRPPARQARPDAVERGPGVVDDRESLRHQVRRLVGPGGPRHLLEGENVRVELGYTLLQDPMALRARGVVQVEHTFIVITRSWCVIGCPPRQRPHAPGTVACRAERPLHILIDRLPQDPVDLSAGRDQPFRNGIGVWDGSQLRDRPDCR